MTKYVIMDSLKYGTPEEIDSSFSEDDVQFLLTEYQLAYGKDWNFTVHEDNEERTFNVDT